MKRKRHTEEQIIAILKEHEAGVKTADLCRKHGISEASFYNWKAKYGGLEVFADIMRLKGGNDWERILEDAIRNKAGKFLLVTTPVAVDKQGVRNRSGSPRKPQRRSATRISSFRYGSKHSMRHSASRMRNGSIFQRAGRKGFPNSWSF